MATSLFDLRGKVALVTGASYTNDACVVVDGGLSV